MMVLMLLKLTKLLIDFNSRNIPVCIYTPNLLGYTHSSLFSAIDKKKIPVQSIGISNLLYKTHQPKNRLPIHNDYKSLITSNCS